MNEHDRSNLEFLMSASADVLQDWFESVSEDDINYAMELLKAYEKELVENRAELATEFKLQVLNNEFPEAKQVLSKFIH